MPFSQKGANYRNQTELERRDRVLGEALSDLASQIQTIRGQGNFGQAGSPLAPHPLTAINVVNAGGFAQVTLTHANAPAGTQYIIHYSTSPNFSTFQEVHNGFSLTLERYLHGKTLYFRAAPLFLASKLAAWTYFGGQANPTPVTF